MNCCKMHTPVLLNEAIRALEVKKGGRYIDATFGLGGYTKEIIKRGGYVLGIEWDSKSLEQIDVDSFPDGLLKIVIDNYANIENIACSNGFNNCDGVVFDLGLSFWQIKNGKRGFSFKKEKEKLDMRISESIKATASDIINYSSSKKLYEIFTKNAEELNSRAIVDAIVRTRRIKKIKTVGDLIACIDNAVNIKNSHFLERLYRRIFQALYIAVNNEFENIKKGLAGAFNIVKNGANIVVVTFHSGHERIVKNLARENKWFVKKIPRIFFEKRIFERSATIRVIKKNIDIHDK